MLQRCVCRNSGSVENEQGVWLLHFMTERRRAIYSSFIERVPDTGTFGWLKRPSLVRSVFWRPVESSQGQAGNTHIAPWAPGRSGGLVPPSLETDQKVTTRENLCIPISMTKWAEETIAARQNLHLVGGVATPPGGRILFLLKKVGSDVQGLPFKRRDLLVCLGALEGKTSERLQTNLAYFLYFLSINDSVQVLNALMDKGLRNPFSTSQV